MRQVNDWNDLEQFGIIPLTGEACGLLMRVLCDVTAEGKRHVEQFFGGTVAIKPDSNWNGGYGEPHVGSVMLPYSILMDLGAFLLVATGTSAVASIENGAVCEVDPEMLPEVRAMFDERVKRYYRRSTDPGTGDRNQHAMSGRVE